MSNYKIDTKCVQSGYTPNNGEPRVLPIYQSTTYKYDSAEHLGDLFDLKAPGHMYSRISNPTLEAVENKIADMEGGVGAMLVSSGQAASLLAILNITRAGQNIVSMSSIYGGTVNLFAVTLEKMGIETRFVTPEMTDAEVEAAFDENTRLFFGETLANPALVVFDFERYAAIAH
jgi:O-acetylhomoserine (thiol)-lyase